MSCSALEDFLTKESSKYCKELDRQFGWDVRNLPVELKSDISYNIWGYVSTHALDKITINYNRFIIAAPAALFILKEVIPHEVAHCYAERIKSGAGHGNVWAMCVKMLNKPVFTYANERYPKYVMGMRDY